MSDLDRRQPGAVRGDDPRRRPDGRPGSDGCRALTGTGTRGRPDCRDETGSPAALGSALETLEARIDETPTKDLRGAVGISSLSILSPERPIVKLRELEKSRTASPS
ncbi:hypothetical protein AArcMg_3332 [Natrarchaeobaculum sulfurireducens]|uniref:Uncharacterized protein n=1 Tax=Natrarchaeobaculum sulfurireducens TaxID=2044521 RepID=A0A346PUW9_9EURY|nr:hypothetical protein AArcMg_3332 [Natrarchaeobaculum sulfurireducens]